MVVAEENVVDVVIFVPPLVDVYHPFHEYPVRETEGKLEIDEPLKIVVDDGVDEAPPKSGLGVFILYEIVMFVAFDSQMA